MYKKKTARESNWAEFLHKKWNICIINTNYNSSKQKKNSSPADRYSIRPQKYGPIKLFKQNRRKMKSAHSMPFIVLKTYVFQYRDLSDPHLQMKTHNFKHSLAHLRRKENQAAIQKPNRKGKNDSNTIQRSVSQEALLFFIILVPQKLRPSRVFFLG